MQWLTSNTTLKLISVLLAIVVWLFIKALTVEPAGAPQPPGGLLHHLGLLGEKQIVEREVPVRLVFSGKLPSGFTAERTNVVPRTVRVKGPKTILGSLRHVETLPVDLTDRRISFRQRVDLAPSDPRVILLSHTSVEVDIRIREPNR